MRQIDGYLPTAEVAFIDEIFQGGGRAGGTGLGLAICAELARAHGGSIALVEGGPGATFEVAIPDRVIDLTRVERRHSPPR